MVVVHAPGTVLSDLLAFSRRFALQDPPVEKGGYLQVCFGFVRVCMCVCVCISPDERRARTTAM